ncbi:MAG: peptidoglycan-binding protein [Alphaproteobacteria bacterium]|nr:peptidoglycan-binding protein [Alphaproteobacteria bacterium]
MAHPTSLRSRAQSPRQQQQQQYVQDERYQDPKYQEQWAEDQQDDNFDVALHLASHAQRLKNVDSSLTYFEQSLKNFQAVYVQERNRQNKYLGILAGCVMVTILAVAFWPRGNAPAAANAQAIQQRSIQQQMAAPVAPAAPVQMPQAQQTYTPNFANANNYAPPAQQQMPQIQAPSFRAPAPVALGARYDQQTTQRNTQAYLSPPAQPAYQQPVQPRLSPFQISVQNKLAASGQAVPPDWQPLFNREASGDKKGKLLIAAKFLKGDGVQRDQAFAVEMIRQAADAGEKEAMMWLAYANQGGNIGKTDINAAIRWFQAAGKAGVTQAYTELGRIYETGADGAPDIETALAWYQRSAAAGDAKAAEAIQRLTAGAQAQQQIPQQQYQQPSYAPSAQSPAQQIQQMIQPTAGVGGQGAQNSIPANDIFVPAPPQAQAQIQQPMTPAIAQQIANEIDNSISPAYSATPVVASVPTPAPSTQVGMSKEQAKADNKAIQRMLRVLGYKVDRVDGEYGPQTASAIRAYQRDHSVYPDGEPSAELIESLMRDVRGQ